MPAVLALGQGLGWIAAGLHVFLRDTIQALQILMFLWFWFTPVFYPAEALTQAPGLMRLVIRLNPMTVIVTGYRNSLLNVAQPPFEELALVFGASMAIFVAGALFFRRAKPAFADVL
jgi:lipopolysaccharide transport system permease protein